MVPENQEGHPLNTLNGADNARDISALYLRRKEPKSHAVESSNADTLQYNKAEETHAVELMHRAIRLNPRFFDFCLAGGQLTIRDASGNQWQVLSSQEQGNVDGELLYRTPVSEAAM